MKDFEEGNGEPADFKPLIHCGEGEPVSDPGLAAGSPLPAEIVKFPVEKVYPRDVCGAEIWAQPEPPEEMVWAVCPWLRPDLQRCNHCPRFEEDPDYGPMQRGCFAFAAEVCRVVFVMQSRAKEPAAAQPFSSGNGTER